MKAESKEFSLIHLNPIVRDMILVIGIGLFVAVSLVTMGILAFGYL